MGWSLTQPFITTTRGGNRGAENQGQQRPKRWKDDFWRHGAPTSVFPIPWRTPSQAVVPQNHRKSPDFEDPPKHDTNSSFESHLGGDTLVPTRSGITTTQCREPHCASPASANVWASVNVIFSLIKRSTTRTHRVPQKGSSDGE